MVFWKNIVPEFWHHKERVAGEKGQQYIFRNKWFFLIQIICILTLVPLLLSTFLFYKSSKTETITDLILETNVMTKGAAVDLEIFFDQYLSTLRIISTQYPAENLKNHTVLNSILNSIGKTNIKFSNLHLIDDSGHIIAGSAIDNDQAEFPLSYLKEFNHHQDYFIGRISSQDGRTYLVVSLRLAQNTKKHLFLSGIIDTGALNLFLGKLKLGDVMDIYLLDKNSILLTSSVYFGRAGTKTIFPRSGDLPSSEVIVNPKKKDDATDFLFSGISKIGDSDMSLGILISNRSFKIFMKRIKFHIIIMAFFSIFFVTIAVCLLVTYLVQVLYRADKVRQIYLANAARNSKMASIGQLAAGVAHEINNPLAIINEKAGLLMDFFSFLDEYKHDDRILAALESITKAVERAGTITHRLLGFARKTDSSVQAICVDDTVQEVLGFVQKEADYKSIHVNIHIPSNLPEIITDRGKLQQILINLINNAIAALDENGQLAIQVRHNIQNESIEIFVQDNGCGISQEHQKKIFEPFFTTKNKIGGTGLGLSLTYGLIRDLHGTLELESEAGVGTTFTITLPYEINQEE